MNITGEESVRLVQDLTAALSDYQTASLFALAALELNLNIKAPYNGTLIDAVSMLVKEADQRGPVGLSRLFEQARLDKLTNPDLEETMRRIEAGLVHRRATGWYIPTDPYQAHILGNDQIIINRHELRRVLARMGAPMGPRLMAVHGPCQSGKSHTLHLITYIWARQKDFRVAFVDLADAPVDSLAPDSLVRNIAQQFEAPVNTIPMQLAPEATWVSELVSWVMGRAQQDALPWWIIFDGSDRRDLLSGSQLLIQELMLRTSQNGLNLRVLLLGYHLDLVPISVRKMVKLETITPISEQDVENYFRALFQARGGHACALEEEITAAMDYVHEQMGECPVTGYIDLPRLSAVVSEMTQELFFE